MDVSDIVVAALLSLLISFEIDDILDDLQTFVSLSQEEPFTECLDEVERQATFQRARALIENGVFPVDPTGRRYPWPVI